VFRLFHRHETPTLFGRQPVRAIPARPVPAWVKTLAPERRFASAAEGASYAASLEAAHVIAHERSGAAQRERDAEMHAAIGGSLANERPR
jgi:hypothetical protein